MRFFALILLVTSPLYGAVVVADNHDTTLSLSQSNYNRLIVQNDKIVEAVFPENAMSIRHDEVDGGIYVMVSETAPFTLFLSTQEGHHFSVTITPEMSLGKTIEIALSGTHPQALKAAVHKENSKPPLTDEMRWIEAMEHHALLPGVVVSHPFNHVEQMGLGITLFLKEVWTMGGVKIERLEVQNRGRESIALLPQWFSKGDGHAIKLMQTNLNPHEKTALYRVREVVHG